MGTDVSLLRFLALGDGFFDAFEPLGAALLQPLVGFPGLFTSFLVDVIRSVGGLPVGLPPGGDPLVDSVRRVPVAAFGQVRFTIEHVDGNVVCRVLLGGVVADGSAVGWVAP